MTTEAITPLRQRMIEDMNARKLCAGTQRGHILSCKRFVAFLKRSPDTATLEDIRRSMSINRLQRPRLVVVGNGMAGMRTVEELVARAPDRFDITVIGGEPHPSYNRILLSSVLAGERTLAEIVIQPSSWYRSTAFT
jgi:hypothetical protein